MLKPMTDALLSALTENHGPEPYWPHSPYWFCIVDNGPPRIGDIKRAVAKHFNVSDRDLTSARRSQDIVTARHVAIYLAKKLTLCSMPQIGNAFRRVHTVAIYAVRNVESRMQKDKQFAAEIAKLEGIFA